MAIYTAEYTSPTDLTFAVYAKARQVQRNGVALGWASATNESAEVYVDKTAPVTAVGGLFLNATATQNAINSLGFVTTATVYLAYTASDAGSGIATATYSIGATATTLTGSPMSITLTENTTSATILQITAEDNAGNFSTSQLSFYVDTTAPTAPSATALTVNTSRIVGIAVPHESVTNFSYTEYSLVNADTEAEIANMKTDFQAPTMTYSFEQDYAYQIKAKVRYVKKSEAASDWSPYSNSVWVDSTLPVITVAAISSIDGGNYCKTTPINIIASATDAHSGIAALTISVGGATATAMDNGSATSVALGSDSLNKTLNIVATDNSGNYITWTKTFVFDQTPPTGLVEADITSTFGRTITWNIDLSSATDATSGLAGFEVRAADSGWGDSSYLYRGQEAVFIQKPTSAATSTVFVALYDKAGNYATAVSATANCYPPANVTSATITATPEINAIMLSWVPVTTNSQGSATDTIVGYRIIPAFKNAAGSFVYSSATVITTSANTTFIPIPLDKLLTSQDNEIKVYMKAYDNWNASSTNWSESGILSTRRVVVADLAGNCFQFKISAVQGNGAKTVNFTTTGENLDPNLNLIIDGLFDNT